MKEKLLEFGQDRKAAAAYFEVTVRTIYNWQKSLGIFEKRENFGPNKLKKHADKIRNAYQKGQEIKDIAKKYGVTFSAISRLLNNVTYKKTEKSTFSEVSVIYNVDGNPNTLRT